MIEDMLSETMEAKRQWKDSFKVLKKTQLLTRNLGKMYQVKKSFKDKGKIKHLSVKQKLWEFNKPILQQEMLREEKKRYGEKVLWKWFFKKEVKRKR